MNEALCVYYSSVESKKVDWLWYPYIPYGKLTLLQGDPGEGKSTFIINVAARLTNGEAMPGTSDAGTIQTVIYQCAEDNVADTIKPRLVAAGADCSRIAFIADESEQLTLEDQRIEQAIKETKARLLIIDPLQAFMAQDGDMQNAVRVRTVLRKLANVAARNNCAVVMIGHMNKGAGGKNLYRSLGSIDIAAISRSVLMIARDNADPNLRYMFPVKSSLAAEGSPIAFRMDEKRGFTWIGKCAMGDSVKNEDANISKLDLARSFLVDILAEGPAPAKDIIGDLAKLSIGQRTVESAKKALGVKSHRVGSAWFWSLDGNYEQRTGGHSVCDIE